MGTPLAIRSLAAAGSVTSGREWLKQFEETKVSGSLLWLLVTGMPHEHVSVRLQGKNLVAKQPVRVDLQRQMQARLLCF